MKEIYLCPRCGGCGLNPHYPKILDVKAGQYTVDMLCPVCKGSGYDPTKHPEKIKEYLEEINE